MHQKMCSDKCKTHRFIEKAEPLLECSKSCSSTDTIEMWNINVKAYCGQNTLETEHRFALHLDPAG